MPTNRFRGDAPAREKILRLLQPNNTTGITVTITVGNKTAEFNGWNAASIVATLAGSAWPELENLSIETSTNVSTGKTDIVISGPADEDFDVGMSVTPTVEVEFSQGGAPVNQQTRLAFGDATDGSFTLTCNGETTAAISLKTSGTLNTGGIETAIEALTGFVAGDVSAVVSGDDVVLTWLNNYAATPVAVTMNASGLNNGGQIIIRETQAARPAAHDIYLLGTDADFEFDLKFGPAAAVVETAEAVAATKRRNIFIIPETSGTGNLYYRYGGEQTSAQVYGATEATLEAALEALSGLENVEVTIETQNSFKRFTIDFEPIGTPDDVRVYTQSQNATVSTTTVGPPEVQTITPDSNSYWITNGTFTLTLDGETTDPISHAAGTVATAAAVQTALRALPMFENTPSNVSAASAGGDTVIEVTFTAGFGDASLMTLTQVDEPTSNAVDVDHTATAGVDVIEAEFEVDILASTGGTFTLTANAETTAAIAYNATPGAVQTALEGLASVGSGDVTVTGSAGDYSIGFTGALSGTDITLTANGASLTGSGTAASVTIKTNEPAAAISAKLSSAFGAAVNVFSAVEQPNSIARRLYVVDMVGFPGTETQLSVSQIKPTESPVGVAIEKVVDSQDTTVNKTFLVDLTNGSLEGEYLGVELDDFNPATIVATLNGINQFSEWHIDDRITNAGLSGGVLASEKLYLLHYVGDEPRLQGVDASDTTAAGGVDLPASSLSVAGDGSFTLLQYGGPNTATSATHEFYLDVLNPLNAGSLAGDYQLRFAEGTTATLTEASNAAAVQSAINTATGVAVAVTGSGTPEDPFSIDYTGDSNERELPTVALQDFTGDGVGAATLYRSAVTGESATAIVRVSTTATGGSYQLGLGTEGPVEFAYNESAVSFDALLTQFPSLATDADATVTFNADSGEYAITWANNLANSEVDAPFLIRNEVTGDDSGSRELSQAPTGPRNWADPFNWSLGRVPQSGDEIVIDAAENAIEYGFRQWVVVTANTSSNVLTAADGVDLVAGQTVQFRFGVGSMVGVSEATDYYVINVDRIAGTFQVSATENGPSVNITDAGSGTHYCGVLAADILIPSTFEQSLGLPRQNADGFAEYRPQFLQIATKAANVIEIGKGDGQGSGLLRIDTGNYAGQVNVFGTGQSLIANVPAFLWGSNSEVADLLVNDGEVGIAFYDDETAALESFNVQSGTLTVGSITVHGNAVATPGTLISKRMSVEGLIQIG